MRNITPETDRIERRDLPEDHEPPENKPLLDAYDRALDRVQSGKHEKEMLDVLLSESVFKKAVEALEELTAMRIAQEEIRSCKNFY